jgi:hypothetical protein
MVIHTDINGNRYITLGELFAEIKRRIINFILEIIKGEI